MVTTIQLDEHTKEMLDKLKVHHRESYNELLLRLVQLHQKYPDKEALEETLEVMSDFKAMREIAEAMEDYDKKRGKTLRQFRKELLA